MSVDLPAPLGPSKPMARPRREQTRFFKMSRLPKRTDNPCKSMTGVRGAAAVGLLVPTAAPGWITVLMRYWVDSGWRMTSPPNIDGKNGP